VDRPTVNIPPPHPTPPLGGCRCIGRVGHSLYTPGGERKEEPTKLLFLYYIVEREIYTP
jgi:hypothetical protein